MDRLLPFPDSARLFPCYPKTCSPHSSPETFELGASMSGSLHGGISQIYLMSVFMSWDNSYSYSKWEGWGLEIRGCTIFSIIIQHALGKSWRNTLYGLPGCYCGAGRHTNRKWNIHNQRQFTVSSSPEPHVCVLWERARAPGGNTQKPERSHSCFALPPMARDAHIQMWTCAHTQTNCVLLAF